MAGESPRTHAVPLTRPHLPSDADAPVFRGVVEVEGRGGVGGRISR